MALKGGDKLKARLEEIARNASKANAVNVGFLADATYPDGTPVAAIAAANEYGSTINVPEHDIAINRNISSSGEFNNGGKFVKSDKANYQTVHHVDAYTITVPARPFFRSMIAQNKDDWPVQLGKIIKAADYDSAVALGRLGELVQGQLQQSIRDTSDPANAKSTIAKKGFDDPLIDSGHLLNSVDYEVKDKQS